MTTQKIELKQVQMAFKDQPCPRIFADAPTAIWCTDGILHTQYRGVSITDPAIGAGQFSPVAEVVQPLAAFYQTLDAYNEQAKQLEAQGVRRVPLVAVTPTPPGGAAH
jgi:hypothetical protein